MLPSAFAEGCSTPTRTDGLTASPDMSAPFFLGAVASHKNTTQQQRLEPKRARHHSEADDDTYHFVHCHTQYIPRTGGLAQIRQLNQFVRTKNDTNLSTNNCKRVLNVV